MICDKCHAENPSGKKFCGDCGAELKAPAEPVAVPGEPGAFLCGRHQKVTTRVRCSRCGVPICPKCMVYGAVGVLCRACAHHKVRVRPRAVLHEAGRVLGPTAQGAGRVVWYLAVWHVVLSIIGGLFGGRRDL